MVETSDTGGSCKQYLRSELAINENQSWNTENVSGKDSGICILKHGYSVNPDTRIINMGLQTGFYNSNPCSNRVVTERNYEFVDDAQDISTKVGIDQNKQFDIVSSGYVTPRTEYVSPAPEISSSGENYTFQSGQSPIRIGTGTFLKFKTSPQISEADLDCRLYNTVSNNNHINSNSNSPINPKEVAMASLVQNNREEPKSSSIPQEIEQEFTYGNITRKERICSEYQTMTEKDVCVYNLEESNNHSSMIEALDNTGTRENIVEFGSGVGVGSLSTPGTRIESPLTKYHYNVYCNTSNSLQPSIGSYENSSAYFYGSLDANKERNCFFQPNIVEYIDYNTPSNSNYVNSRARTRPRTEVLQENMYGVGGISACGQNSSNYTGNHCNYYSIYGSTTPPSSHLNSNNQVIQTASLREVELIAENASQYQNEQINEIYDRFVNPNILIGGRVSGVTGLPAPPVLATPPGLATPPSIPILSGINGFHANNVPNSLQVFKMYQMEADRIENGDENYVRKRRRSGTVGSDRNFYIVDFICEIPVNIKSLFTKNLKEFKEGSRVLREFSLGSLAMRRSGSLAPTVIKCFFHSYRDGISRLQCKSKRHEGRPFLFVINETKLSRPWVFCPNVKCIRRAKSSGKLKGRIKVYEYCPGSDKIILSPTFLKCARGFLTSDYYFCATLCPQQKYADHESNFWGEDFTTGFGGNRIQETLTSETENGGSGIALADYILFCNSKHQFVATFRRFPIGARHSTPPVKNSSYVNTSSPDKIFGDETEISLVNIMTSVIRSLEGSSEPTIYTSTDKFIQEISVNPGGASTSQTNGLNRQIMQPINLRDYSFGHSLSENIVPIEPDDKNLTGGVLESTLRVGLKGNISSKWNESPNSSFSGTQGFQLPSDHVGGQHIYNSADFIEFTKDEKANIYVPSSSLDIEDSFSNKLETYSTGYTDEDSFSTFNDSGAQISFNFDPQDALVVESSTNWVLDVLLNKSSDNHNYSQNQIQNSQNLSSHQSGSFSTDLNSIDHTYDTNIHNQNKPISINQNVIADHNASKEG